MTEDIGHVIIAPDPEWGRVTRLFKLLRMARKLSKMPSDCWYITIVIKDSADAVHS